MCSVLNSKSVDAGSSRTPSELRLLRLAARCGSRQVQQPRGLDKSGCWRQLAPASPPIGSNILPLAAALALDHGSLHACLCRSISDSARGPEIPKAMVCVSAMRPVHVMERSTDFQGPFLAISSEDPNVRALMDAHGRQGWTLEQEISVPTSDRPAFYFASATQRPASHRRLPSAGTSGLI